MPNELSIAQIADAAGISRRAIRFYIQEKLLPPPAGAGRGSHYQPAHLEQLKRILELQRAGHALDAIRRIFAGGKIETPEPPRPSRTTPLSATLLTRVELLPGVELSFDAAKFSPDPHALLELQQLARKMFRP